VSHRRRSTTAEDNPGVATITRPVTDPATCDPVSARETFAEGLTLFARPSTNPIPIQVVADPVDGPVGPVRGRAALLRRRSPADRRRSSRHRRHHLLDQPRRQRKRRGRVGRRRRQLRLRALARSRPQRTRRAARRTRSASSDGIDPGFRVRTGDRGARAAARADEHRGRRRGRQLGVRRRVDGLRISHLGDQR
jgi:hypothetical protein